MKLLLIKYPVCFLLVLFLSCYEGKHPIDVNEITEKIILDCLYDHPVMNLGKIPLDTLGTAKSIVDHKDLVFSIYPVFSDSNVSVEFISELEKNIKVKENEYFVIEKSGIDVGNILSNSRHSFLETDMNSFQDIRYDLIQKGISVGHFQFSSMRKYVNNKGIILYSIGLNYFCGKLCISQKLYTLVEKNGEMAIQDQVILFPNRVY